MAFSAVRLATILRAQESGPLLDIHLDRVSAFLRDGCLFIYIINIMVIFMNLK